MGQANAVAKAEAVGAKKVHVHVSRLPMLLKFEVMMLNVCEAVAHFGFAGADISRPQPPAVTLDCYPAWHRGKFRIEDQLRTNGTVAQLRSGQIQVIPFLETVIGEFVACGHPDSSRLSVGIDEVDSRDLGFLAAVFRIGGNLERLSMSAKNRAAAFVKPFRWRANRARSRPPAVPAPAEHFHAVGEVFEFRRRIGFCVHGLAIAGTSQM